MLILLPSTAYFTRVATLPTVRSFFVLANSLAKVAKMSSPGSELPSQSSRTSAVRGMYV